MKPTFGQALYGLILLATLGFMVFVAAVFAKEAFNRIRGNPRPFFITASFVGVLVLLAYLISH